MTGRFPPPEMIKLPGDPISYPAYYFGKEDKAGLTVKDDSKQRYKSADLPPAKKGNVWRKERITEGKIYWIEVNKDVADVMDAAEKKKRAEAEAYEERGRRIREAINAPPQAPAAPQPELGAI